MKKRIALFLVVGYLVTASIAAGKLPDSLRAVVAGVESRQKAEGIASETREILKQFPTIPARVLLQKNSGLWLVEITPIESNDAASSSLLSVLSKRYPGILLLGRTTRNIPKGADREEASKSALRSREHSGRGWEWLTLLIMALAGVVAYGLRKRRLRSLGKEQEILENRQRSLRLKLKGEEYEK